MVSGANAIKYPHKKNEVAMFLCYISAPVAAPGNLTVVNISANELNVSWERPNEIDINGVLRYYILEYYIVTQTATLATANVSGDTLSTVLGGLNNFTSYSVSVAAFTIRTGPFSTEVETTSENGKDCVRIHSSIYETYVFSCFTQFLESLLGMLVHKVTPQPVFLWSGIHPGRRYCMASSEVSEFDMVLPWIQTSLTRLS